MSNQEPNVKLPQPNSPNQPLYGAEAEKTCDDKYYELLEQLQAVDFVLVELNLYLDTHPDDYQAIEQYNKLTKERTQLAHQFQLLYGPLMHFGHAFSKYPWEWSKSPWPWQV
ncbi:CotJB protein [compost metagenome]